uniref:glycoside hydrolase family 3 C-terminal domain-containing protein n=1 Tax=Enterobacter sp. IF2SW-P2 TaxID=1841144 RepID=UPI000AC33EB6
SGTVGEGSDTDSLNLPGVQQQLLEALVAPGTPLNVVMTGGRAVNPEGREWGRRQTIRWRYSAGIASRCI